MLQSGFSQVQTRPIAKDVAVASLPTLRLALATSSYLHAPRIAPIITSATVR